MPSANLKERLIEDIVTLPDKKVKEVLDFVETNSERIPRWLVAGLVSEYKKTVPYVKIPCPESFRDRRVLHYLKLKEDDWFLNFVNKRGRSAKSEKKAGEKFIRLEDLQKEYR